MLQTAGSFHVAADRQHLDKWNVLGTRLVVTSGDRRQDIGPTEPVPGAAEPAAEIAPFVFEGATVRTLQIDGVAWFVGKDVAELLGYANHSQALRDNCKCLKKLTSVSRTEVNDFNGLPGNTLIIPEADVYRLAMRSKLPGAERFEAWVVDEVLPAIPKTGIKAMETADRRSPAYGTAAAPKLCQRLCLGPLRWPLRWLLPHPPGRGGRLARLRLPLARQRPFGRQ